MIPLALFLLGCAGVYLGTVEAAFDLLMRLSLRLLAERGSRRADLGRYLEDPVLLFLPVRLMLWLVVATATVLVSVVAGGSALHVIGVAVLATITAVFVCVHLVPLLIVRRNPEHVLEVLLPSFTVRRSAAARDGTADSPRGVGAIGRTGSRRRVSPGMMRPKRRRRTWTPGNRKA
jgi:hypothetical protein